MNKITIVTICFNDLDSLVKTCASIDAQTQSPYQHLVINGSTTNDIENWATSTVQPNYRKVITERDRGISDAFNKGVLKVASGIIHLLNAGDIYASDTVLAQVQKVFDAQPNVQWISGCIKIKRAGIWVEIGKPFDKTQLYKGMRSVAHPTWFVKKEVYDRIGLFNEQYKIAMDYDLMCRIQDEPYYFLNQVITVFDDTGISSVQYLKSLQQNVQVYEANFGFSIKSRLWQFRLKLFYYLLNTQFGKALFKIKNKLTGN